MDLWPFFFFNTTQKSLATVDIDACMGWCISNIQQFKSLKKNTIAFSKSISVCLWMIWCMSGMDEGDSDTSDVKIVCHDLWKNWYSMSAVKILRTTVKSFCMKSLIVFFPDALLSSHCNWDMMKLIRLIEQSHKSHNAPFPYPMCTFQLHCALWDIGQVLLWDLWIRSIWHEHSNHLKKGIN